ncbi:7933_t:CDS:2, partial [Cetraspora pellucida]
TTKALNMSKLRADITYQHRRESGNLFSVSLSTTSTQTTHSNVIKPSNMKTLDIINSDNINSSDKIANEIQNESSNKNNDEEAEDNEGCDSYISEAEFEMLDEEEETSITQDKDDTVELDDSIHPAIDENAKWKLSSLFDLLDLPFH